MEKECIICGKKFKPRNQCQITCSDKCSIENKRRRDKLRKQGKAKQLAILTCPQCGKEFKQKVVTQVYCSDKCRNDYNKERYLEEYHAQIESEKKFCAYCDKEFTPTMRAQKYCSKECCGMAWGYQATLRKCTCKTCGKEFTDVYNAKYCSKKCRNEAIKKVQAKQAETAVKKGKTMADWTREARECNMDYGTYRAQIEVFGKTYEELKANADNRAMPLHAHAGKSSKNACDSGYGVKVG